MTGTTAPAQRHGEPRRRRDDGLVPLRHRRARAPATTPSARARRRPAARRSARARRRVAFSQAITGLTPATTYYFCAIASNSVGTSFGSVAVASRRPPRRRSPPSAATSVTSTSATLNGSANPNGAATTGWFRYGTTEPGHLQRHLRHARAGERRHEPRRRQRLRGVLAVAHAASRRGRPTTSARSPRTRRAPAFGAVLSFTTPLAPTVTTSAATAVTVDRATLNGSANPNGGATTASSATARPNPGHLQRHLRHARAGDRRPDSSLGAGSSRGRVLAGDHRPRRRRRPTTSARSPRTPTGPRSARCSRSRRRRPRRR